MYFWKENVREKNCYWSSTERNVVAIIPLNQNFWSSKMAFHFTDEGLLNAYILHKGNSEKSHCWAQTLIVSRSYLLHCFSGCHLPEHAAHSPFCWGNVHQRDVLRVTATTKKRSKLIAMWGLHTQTKILSSTLLQNLPHWTRLNIENEISFPTPYCKQLNI